MEKFFETDLPEFRRLLEIQHRAIQEALKACGAAIQRLQQMEFGKCACGHTFVDDKDYETIDGKKVCGLCASRCRILRGIRTGHFSHQ